MDDPPRPEALEDAYARYAGKRVLRDRWQETAFSNTSQAEPFYTLNVTMGFLPVDRLKEIAARYGASITEYLSAVLLQSILENQEVQRPRRPRPAALAIPIDLRGWFPSATLRNFILTVRLCVDPTLGPYTFPELVRYVHHYMRLHINPQEMRARFTGNVHFTANRFLQLIPIFLKNPVMSLSYQLVGVRPFSATYTNPGLFRVPPEMAPSSGWRSSWGRPPGPPSLRLHQLWQYHGCHLRRHRHLQRDGRRFFTHLVREGIPVKVESNRTR